MKIIFFIYTIITASALMAQVNATRPSSQDITIKAVFNKTANHKDGYVVDLPENIAIFCHKKNIRITGHTTYYQGTWQDSTANLAQGSFYDYTAFTLKTISLYNDKNGKWKWYILTPLRTS
jgi:hypothetical protein